MVGFIVREIYKSDLDMLFRQSLNQSDSRIELFEYADIEILNRDSVIYHHKAEGNHFSSNNGILIQSSPSNRQWSDFGQMTMRINIPKVSMLNLMIEEQEYLLFLPFFIYMLSYLTLLQMLKGLREGDKQYFDTLTQTYNRNGLHQKVYKKIEKAMSTNKTAHIFSIDANKFKQINDKYGHDVGDKAIKIIATAAKHICKSDDDIVRLGGDEFLIVLYIASEQEFEHEQFMGRLNQKIAYDCKAQSIPRFTVSAGYVVFDLNSHQSLSQMIRYADSILLSKKSVEKIEMICEEFDSYDINLSADELKLKLDLNERLNFIQAEHFLQHELNAKVLRAYHNDSNYLMSNYFQMMFSCTRENDDLHHFRMKIVDSHYQTGISMSVFYFLFVKYSNFLFRNIELSDEEIVVNNRVLSYELHFISNLKMR